MVTVKTVKGQSWNRLKSCWAMIDRQCHHTPITAAPPPTPPSHTPQHWIAPFRSVLHTNQGRPGAKKHPSCCTCPLCGTLDVPQWRTSNLKNSQTLIQNKSLLHRSPSEKCFRLQVARGQESWGSPWRQRGPCLTGMLLCVTDYSDKEEPEGNFPFAW